MVGIKTYGNKNVINDRDNCDTMGWILRPRENVEFEMVCLNSVVVGNFNF